MNDQDGNRRSRRDIMLETGWRTDNLSLAAYLRYQQHRFEIELENSKAWVYFKETDKLRKDIMDYLAGDAIVEPDNFAKWLLTMRADARRMQDEEQFAG